MKIAKVLADVLKACGIKLGTSDEVAAALKAKLDRLKTVEGEFALKFLEVARLGEVERDLKQKLADALGVAKDQHSIAMLYQGRMDTLREKDKAGSALIHELIFQRKVWLKGGVEAEMLLAMLKTMGSSEAPDKLDKPAPETFVDGLGIRSPDADTKPLSQGTLERLEKDFLAAKDSGAGSDERGPICRICGRRHPAGLMDLLFGEPSMADMLKAITENGLFDSYPGASSGSRAGKPSVGAASGPKA